MTILHFVEVVKGEKMDIFSIALYKLIFLLVVWPLLNGFILWNFNENRKKEKVKISIIALIIYGTTFLFLFYSNKKVLESIVSNTLFYIIIYFACLYENKKYSKKNMVNIINNKENFIQIFFVIATYIVIIF
jgi:hypothetical protein